MCFCVCKFVCLFVCRLVACGCWGVWWLPESWFITGEVLPSWGSAYDDMRDSVERVRI